VPEAEAEEADAGVHYVTVEQDSDQAPEELDTNCSAERKPRFNIYLFSFIQSFTITIVFNMCIYVQELDWNPRCMIPRYLCSLTSMLGR